MDSLPVIAFPLHDGDGAMLDHLARITPDLKALFSRAVVSVTPPTLSAHNDRVDALGMDPFFAQVRNPQDSRVGGHFLNGFRRAVEICHPSRQLHLCTLDRLAYALQSEHRESFMRDVAQVATADLTFMTVMVLLLHDEIITWDVDWLAWEDPFIFGKDAAALKAAQEEDPADREKRLAYAVAMVRTLLMHPSSQCPT